MNLTLEHLTNLSGNGPAREILGALYVPLYGSPDWDPVDETHDLDPIKEELLSLPWVTKRTARHEYFMAEKLTHYSYGGGTKCPRCDGVGATTHDTVLKVACGECGGDGIIRPQYHSKPFSPCTKYLMDGINERLGTELNVCFLNKYDDQHQHLGWHADEFPGMRADQPIAVISFGAEREIWLKDKRGFACECQDSAVVSEFGIPPCAHCGGAKWLKAPPNEKQPSDHRIKLEEASLFIMPPGYQDTHLHRIPKHDRPCGWRISLTFRAFA